MLKRRRGLSLVESILALCIVLMAFLVFMSVFSSSSRATVQSRNRTGAILLANTLIDEFEAHPYGAPAPKWWTSTQDQPLAVWVEGKQPLMAYHKKLEYEKGGSFVGNGNGDDDVVVVTISWQEAGGDPQAGVVVPTDNKVLKFRYPVWR
jgi:hypothetical protein